MAERILMNEFKTLCKEKWVAIELVGENVLEWDIALMVINPDSLYYGGYFKGHMTFPSNYPYSPPKFKFNRPLLHPNIYKDGNLCISILHAPGDDEMSGETASERWSPAQRVESVLLSIVSLLDDAECSSPANVDAGVMLRKSPEDYKRMVKADVEASKADIPEGFIMPTHQSTTQSTTPRVEKVDESEFWVNSDDEGQFRGSDTDADENMEEDEDLSGDLESGAEDDDDQEMEDAEKGLSKGDESSEDKSYKGAKDGDGGNL